MTTFSKLVKKTHALGKSFYIQLKHAKDFFTQNIKRHPLHPFRSNNRCVVEEDKGVPFPKELFITHANKFVGTYEALYKSVHGKITNHDDKISVFQDWKYRIEGLNQEPLSTWFVSILKGNDIDTCMQVLLQEIMQSGIKRDDRIEFDVSPKDLSCYLEWTDKPLNVGDHVTILSAAWKMNEVCIEKGLLQK